MANNDVLLVEGKDDWHVLGALLTYHQLINKIAVKEREGIEKLVASLRADLKASDLEHLGIVVDANTSLSARWDSICNVLRSAGSVDIPATPSPDGTVVSLDQGYRTVAVGIWLMPDNQLPGMLEDFVAFLVPPGDALWGYARECLDGLPESRFPSAHRPKAHIHTWLAWQEDPGTPMGLAITKRYLDANASHVPTLMAWIRRVFAL